MIYYKKAIFSVLLVLLLNQVSAQKKVQQVVPEKTRILFVLDGSGSMNGIWENNQSRIEVAKKILVHLVDSLRENPQLELGLRVYGHRYPRTAKNCKDSRLEIPFGTKNHDAIIAKLDEVVPKGTTPITYSLEQAANDFPGTSGYRNILILITDGVESCDGDPCATSLAMQRKGVFLKPFVIGLGLKGGKVLDCVGKYVDSDNTESFNQVLNQAIETTFSTTTVSVELLDSQNKPTETNINVSFLNEMTGTPVYEFVHYLDTQGRPDSVTIDPVLSYSIVVNTVPQVVRKNVNIINGRHNVIRIPAPQGDLMVKQTGRNNSFPVIVRRVGDPEILNTQLANESFRYLKGDYEIETLTLPRRKFKITITPNQTETITLPTPGLVNINTITHGFGSIFEITPDGVEKWVCHLSSRDSRHAYHLLPGTYKVAFRIMAAEGSKYTGIKTFVVNPGQTLNVNVFE